MEYTNNNINKSIEALYMGTINSSFGDSEKNALKVLLQKLAIYYSNEYNAIQLRKDSDDYMYKINKLVSEMADYIVMINDTLDGKNDVYYIVNMIYKEINYDEKKGKFKRKRLI